MTYTYDSPIFPIDRYTYCLHRFHHFHHGIVIYQLRLSHYSLLAFSIASSIISANRIVLFEFKLQSNQISSRRATSNLNKNNIFCKREIFVFEIRAHALNSDIQFYFGINCHKLFIWDGTWSSCDLKNCLSC
jgi:hypothetical protein